MGTSELKEIDQCRSPGASRIMRQIRDNGTKIWLNHGTHDPLHASWLSFQWVDRARKLGIAVRHDIAYRFGHNNCRNPFESARQCVESIITGEELELDGNYHYGRASELPEDWSSSKLLDVERQPVFFEGPKVVIKGEANDFALYGMPGMEYRLTLEPACEPKPEHDEYEIVIMQGKLASIADMRPDFSYAIEHKDISGLLLARHYRYRLSYKFADDAQWRHG